MKHYYLLNGTVKKGGEMPETHDLMRLNDEFRKVEDKMYNDWKDSLQPCEIDESELDKIKKHIFHSHKGNLSSYCNKFDNPIDITDIVEEKTICGYDRCVNESEGCIECKYPKTKIYFKQPTEKQVESECEAVEFAEWLNLNCATDGDNTWRYYLKAGNLFTTKQLYEIFKNR